MPNIKGTFDFLFALQKWREIVQMSGKAKLMMKNLFKRITTSLSPSKGDLSFDPKMDKNSLKSNKNYLIMNKNCRKWKMKFWISKPCFELHSPNWKEAIKSRNHFYFYLAEWSDLNSQDSTKNYLKTQILLNLNLKINNL